MIEIEQTGEPDPELYLYGESEIPLSAEAGEKLNISPLRVKLEQWIGNNELLLVGIFLIVLIGLFFIVRGVK